MKEYAFKMELKQGYEEEYEIRHDQIWPEFVRALKEADIREYSIYLDKKTGGLFAVQKLDDENETDRLSELPVMKKWWDYMKDIMEVNPDHSPVVIPLENAFHMKEYFK